MWIGTITVDLVIGWRSTDVVTVGVVVLAPVVGSSSSSPPVRTTAPATATAESTASTAAETMSAALRECAFLHRFKPPLHHGLETGSEPGPRTRGCGSYRRRVRCRHLLRRVCPGRNRAGIGRDGGLGSRVASWTGDDPDAASRVGHRGRSLAGSGAVSWEPGW